MRCKDKCQNCNDEQFDQYKEGKREVDDKDQTNCYDKTQYPEIKKQCNYSLVLA